MFEEKFFLHRKVNHAGLVNYGFVEAPDGYQYVTDVMNGQFRLYVFVTADGAVSTKMIDTISDDEYLLYKVASSVGSYVGEVRDACERVLADIAENCYDPESFRGEQTITVIEYVRNTYGDELEFLWEKYPDCAVLRRRDSRKWYAVIMTIPKMKLGIDSDEVAEIIDLRLAPELMSETVDNKRYFPGWHMNKKSWYTMILDGTVPTEEICRRIDDSYLLAVK